MSLVNRFINYARSNPRLYKTLLPVVNKYADLAGYRKVGLVLVSPPNPHTHSTEVAVQSWRWKTEKNWK